MNLKTSNIEYNDYLAMMIYTDAEWTRRRIPYDATEEDALKVLFRNDLELVSQCLTLKRKINDNYERICIGNAWEVPKKNEYSIGNKKEGYLAPYLFNPVSYVPFGHADSLNIVLLDDFDSIHYLTAGNITTIEEVNLLLCPRVESLFNSNESSIFCNLHDTVFSTEIISDIPRVHAFQKNYPLMIFTKYKIGGISNLYGGIYFEEYIFKAMAKKIYSVLNSMKQYRNESAIKNILGDKDGQDLDQVKVSFLNLQGSEEIGTIIFCQNYSVGMSLVSALSSLSYGEIYKYSNNEQLRNHFDKNHSYQDLIRLACGDKKKNEQVSGSHIFRWVNSSLAVSSGAFMKPDEYPCFGKVESHSDVQICAGHRSAVMERLTLLPRQEEVKEKSVRTHKYKTGISELALMSYSKNIERENDLIDVRKLINSVQKNLKEFGRCHKDDHGRDIVDIVTSLTIPLPSLVIQGKDFLFKDIVSHISHLSEILICIQRHLFYPTLHVERYEQNIIERSTNVNDNMKSGKMDLSKLKDSLVYIGLPISLRRAIEFLYQYYATILADPFHFDTVLDIYDSFLTLYEILTKSLPKKISHSNDICDEGIIEQVALFVHAIRNALQHRMARAYPETSIRDMGIDLRGGVNQLLLGANSPLLCGLDLFKKYQEKKGLKEHYQVGGITCVGFLPGARCHSLFLGTEDEAKLAFFEVDVSHIFHVGSYIDYFHEVFHLIFDDHYSVHLKNKIGDNPQLKDRLSEIFSNILCKMIVHNNKIDTYLFYTLSNFSKSPISTGVNDWDTVVRYYEMFLRVFLVVDDRSKSGVKIPYERFKDMINKYGHFCSEYERLWTGQNKNAILDYSEKQFYLLYPELVKYIQKCEEVICEIVSLYKKESDYIELDIIQEDIRRAFLVGKPLVSLDMPEHCRLNVFLLICTMLNQYTPDPEELKVLEKKIHLKRSEEDRHVIYGDYDGKKWYEFQVEKGATSMFCPIPYNRRRRVLKQIVFLKSVAGYSLIQRQARFNEMLKDVFGNLEGIK